MKKMWLKIFVKTVVAALILAVSAVPSQATSNARTDGKGFSIVSLQPDVVQQMRAQGKKITYPIPNTANKGKKFNPEGDVILPIPTADEQNVLVLFAEFTTPPPGGPATRLDLGDYFDPMLFGTVYDPPEYAAFSGYPKDRTLYNYYKEVSYGYIEITTQNMPSDMNWTNVGHPYDYYTKADGIHDNGFGPYPENVQGIVLDVVRAVDPYVDFSVYAVDGVVPNLFIVYAGTGAEWSADPSLIWSHSWDLKEGTGLTDGDLTFDGVKINNYAMMPEVGGDVTGYTGVVSGPFPPTVGVYAHEYGHVLGLPDQYDYGYESDGTDVYSLMAGGSWNRYPSDRIFSGNSPAHLDAWSKYMLGFVTPVEITSTSSLTLLPAETNAIAYKMVVPNSGGKEYFLFENRQAIGFDQGLQRFGTHGLAIYHVDDTVFTRNYWRPNEAENWKEFRSEGWRKAWTDETHYGISIIQADDQWDLEHAVYYLSPFSSLAGDLYPGRLGKTEFSSYTKPNSSNYYFWSGSDPKYGYSGVTVKNIQESTEGIITADFSFVPWTPKKK
ncbi:MAG: M6 family metalloprotease domain-containing protein [Anaerolineales bacterium]|nr:M6 family metalloprotease domain-containing protein [Anaerolineales bacterium]